MPRKLGYRMPAEWEPHAATWLAWPHESSDWPGKFAPIPWLYGEIVRLLARVERVRILVEHADAEQSVRRILKKCHADLNAVDFFHHATNRSWTRDFCPLFVKNPAGEIAVTDWKFNGWAKYPNYAADDAVAALHREKAEASAIRTRIGARRRQHRRQRGGEVADHRGMPAVRRAGAQSRRYRGARSSARWPIIWAPPKSSGWAAASRATILTATSTTSRASPRPIP